jgi:hypothetical protein
MFAFRPRQPSLAIVFQCGGTRCVYLRRCPGVALQQRPSGSNAPRAPRWDGGSSGLIDASCLFHLGIDQLISLEKTNGLKKRPMIEEIKKENQEI